MPIIRFGNTLRLTGKDAKDYLKETGRAKLPSTVNEYNQAIQETINLVFTYLRTGGIGYRATKVKGNFEIELWEHTHKSDDLYNYETNSPELRAKVASILLKEKEDCKAVKVIQEEPFDYQGPPKWSHGKWWRMLVQCE